MCRTWERKAHDELSVSEWGAVFDEAPALCWLDLTGGEPLLRRDFPEIVDAALSRLPALQVLHFQTNGWLTERAVDVVRRAREGRPEVDLIVTVSIDGPPNVHDAIRGRPGSFDRAMRTLLALHAAARHDPGLQVHVGTTVTADNAECFEAVGPLLAERVPGFEPRRWHWNLGQRSAHFFGNADRPGVEPGQSRASMARAIARQIRRRGVPRDFVSWMESTYLVNLHAVAGGAPSKIPCQALRSTLFISPEGDVYPCHIWDRPLGNVRETSLRAVWDSAGVAAARRDVERLACGGCFSACEAYPALAGAPIATGLNTLRRLPAALR